MTGARLAQRRYSSSDYLTAGAADNASLDRVELGHKRRSFEEVGPLAKRGVIGQEFENIGRQRRGSFAPASSIWAEMTDVASSEESPTNAESVLGPAVCNRYAHEQEVANVDNMVGENPAGVRDDPSRTLPPTFHADQGYVHDPLIHDRVRKYRSTLKGDVVPPDSWQNENSLRDLVDWEPVEEALRPEGLMVARAAMMSSGTPSGRAVV